MADVLGRLLIAGFVRLHVLHHAVKEGVSGVDMVAELGRHGYRLSPGTIYPILAELKEAGLLTEKAEVVQGRRRKYYRATAKGRQALDAAKVKLRELVDEVLEDDPPESTR